LFHDDELSLERIRRLPRRRSTPVPPTAKITAATATADGAVSVQGTARHATRFVVWYRGPGEKEFQRLAEVRATKVGKVVYEAGPLAPGEHDFQLAGVNSRGTGPASAIVTVKVNAAQAA
jgi:hypothetical protein